MNIWILLSGDFYPPLWQINEDDFIIAVDGGIKHAQHLNITPHIWLGDFDSSNDQLKQRYRHIPQISFPIDKDETDYELALNYIEAQNMQGALSIIGSSGNEADHAFNNIHLLAAYPFHGVLWQKNATIIFGKQFTMQAEVTIGDKVSVFALKEIQGLHYQGLKWQIPSGKLSPFTSLGSRNIASDFTIQISWTAGFGLIYLTAPKKIKIT